MSFAVHAAVKDALAESEAAIEKSAPLDISPCQLAPSAPLVLHLPEPALRSAPALLGGARCCG